MVIVGCLHVLSSLSGFTDLLCLPARVGWLQYIASELDNNTIMSLTDDCTVHGTSLRLLRG